LEVAVDHASLAALFRRILLASAPILSGGCFSTSTNTTGCPAGEMHRTIVVAEAGDGGVDASIEDLLARCQASATDCLPLCERALSSTTSPNGQIKGCSLVTVDGGLAVQVAYTPVCLGGRRPEGLAPGLPCGDPSPLGAWLAATAHLEAASIDAFAILAAEIEAHGGPRPLVRAAHAASRDERRHANVIGLLAARHGVAPPAVTLTRRPIRDIESIARENAVEGCVRETFAALVACRQARAAGDPALGAAMAGIARDETRHAALAWAVDGWARGLLDPAARRRVREARRQASEALVAEQALPSSPILRRQAGLPGEDEATRMAEVLQANFS
jgi:hypothetical protein